MRSDMNEMRKRADEVCRLILTEDYPDVDIAIARGNLREYAEEHFPDRMRLYDMVYESRFNRLVEQFRAAADVGY